MNIHKDSPLVIYDNQLFHRNTEGRLETTYWRGTNAGDNSKRDVGLPIPRGEVSVHQETVNLNEIVSILQTPQANEDIDLIRAAQHDHVYTLPNIPENGQFEVKFVLLDEDNNRVYDKDFVDNSYFTKGPNNRNLQVEGSYNIPNNPQPGPYLIFRSVVFNSSGSLPGIPHWTSQITHIDVAQKFRHLNYELYIKRVISGNTNEKWYLWTEKKQGDTGAKYYIFDWNNVPTSADRIWNGRTSGQSISTGLSGYYLIEVKAENNQRPF